MHEINNEQLVVTLLDPHADRARLGARYCAGGYIFQVTDHRLGPLMAGPTYPDEFNVFHGQGIPDSFNATPLRGVGDPNEALIIGVGVCTLNPSSQNNTVKTFCNWTSELARDSVRMSTIQHYRAWSLTLDRVVTLMGRTVRSHIRLANTSATATLPMSWFPHPFYPHDGDELIKLNVDVTFGESAGYELNPNGFIRRKNWPWSADGYFQSLSHHATAPLVIQQRHPQLGLVSAKCSYVPGFFPIWGNGRTFSWEPFFERIIGPGQALEWFIDYDF